MPIGTAFVRIVAALILALPVLVSFSYYLGAVAISDTLLRPAHFIESLRKNNLYDRFYAEILLSEQFNSWADRLVGNFDLTDEEQINLLRTIVPPAYVQAETERGVTSVLGFLNYQHDDLDVYIDLTQPIQNIKPAVLGLIDRRIDALATEPTTVGDSPREMEFFLNSVAQGTLPSGIPSADGLPSSQLVRAYEQALDSLAQDPSVSPEVVASLQQRDPEIRAALENGDVRSALKLASRAAAEPRIDAAIAELRANLDSEDRVDLIAQLAAQSQRSRADVVNDVTVTRFLLGEGTGTLAQGIALAIMALCVAAIAAVFVPYWRHVIFWPSIVLLVTGLLLLSVWWLLVLDIPMWVSAVCSGAEHSPCALNLDVASSLAASIGLGFVGPTVIAIMVGLVGILASLVVGGLADRRSSTLTSSTDPDL